MFLKIMSTLAQADIFDGGTIYAAYFHLKQIPSINAQQEFFGIDNMMMLACSGSYFIIQVGLLIMFLISKGINYLAVKFAKYEIIRTIGIKVYQTSLISHLCEVSEKLFIESYFELCVAIFINLQAVFMNNDVFIQFFLGYGNEIN